MRRQASTLIVRVITEERWAPLGVWIVREAAREALRNPPRKFETLEAALVDMATRIRTPSRDWRPQSELVRGGRRRSRVSSESRTRLEHIANIN